MSEYAVSPDGQNIVYTLRYTDMEQNKNNTELYLMPVAGGEAQRLTYTAESEFCPVWKDNNTLLFCRGNEIRSIDIKSSEDGLFAGNLTIMIDDNKRLNQLIKKIQGVKGVKNVTR
jgi:Tol biopolymer transport system component